MSKVLWVWLFSALFLTGGACAADWKELKSDHFIVLYKNAPEGFIEKVLDRAEDIYKETTTTLGFTRYKGWTWEDRVKIYVHDSAEQYKAASGYEWSAAQVSTRSRTILSYPSASGFFDSTLPHELGHIILRDFIGFKARVPAWFEEGVAMYHEEGRRWGADDLVRKAIANARFISLADLGRLDLGHGSQRELVELFYAEASSVVGFLIETGNVYRFTRLCNDLKDGTPFEKALKQAYMKYQTLNALEKDWKDHLAQ